MNYLKKLFFLYCICFLQNTYTQQLAFPTAMGAGAYSTGGRGGIVLKVTNLNDAGPGSLRAALTTEGPRIIVFDISGTIHLNTIIELGVNQSNFTVAGQTAPEGGITIAGRPIQMGGGYDQIGQEPCHNAIWRYIRFRNGSFTGVADEYLHNGFISTGTKGLILDHCSFSFCDDQGISMNPDYDTLKNITIQRSVLSENATGIVYGSDLNYPSGDLTVIYNLFVDQGHRTPNIGGNLRFDIINNVCFNWQARLTSITSGKPLVNYVGNYLKEGSFYAQCEHVVEVELNQNIYSANNFHSTLYPNPQPNDQGLWKSFFTRSSLPSTYFTDDLFPLLEPAGTLLSPLATYETVLSDVGANKFLKGDGSYEVYLDTFDATKIANVKENISSAPHNKDWTLPNLPNNKRSENYDSNNDGIPDEWKIARGFGIDEDLSTHTWPSGYVGIEEFLNGVDLPLDIVETTTNTDSSISPEALDGQLLKVYPNPNNIQSFSIEVSNKINILKLEIVDIKGKVVYQDTSGNSNYNLQPQLANGLYFVLVYTEQALLKEEIIVNK